MITPKQSWGSLDDRLQAHLQLRVRIEHLLDEWEQRAGRVGSLAEVETAIIP